MNKEKHYKINIDNMYYLVIAVFMEYLLTGQKCPYTNLLSQVESYRLKNTPFDLSIHNIDDFMVDAYKLYIKYISIEDKISSFSDISEKMFGVNETSLRKEFKRITGTFEDIIQHCDFEGVQIKGIQKNFLNDLLNKAIEVEDYEKAAELRDKMNSI